MCEGLSTGIGLTLRYAIELEQKMNGDPDLDHDVSLPANTRAIHALNTLNTRNTRNTHSKNIVIRNAVHSVTIEPLYASLGPQLIKRYTIWLATISCALIL